MLGNMEAKELQLGDWVCIKKDRNRPFKITEFARDRKHNTYYFEGQTLSGTYIFPFCEGEIEPVKLTPEILVKNGFEKSDRWENYYVRKNAMVDEFGNVWNLLVLCDDLLFCELHIHIGENPYDPDDSYCMPDFQYVHELQQKLRSNYLIEIADSLIL